MPDVTCAEPKFDRYSLALGVVRARMALHFRLSPKDSPDARKIFVIGHPRCGTTSHHQLFEANGLRSQHSSGDWDTHKYDCFSDFGQMRPIAAYERAYPKAMFVLNTRPVMHYLVSLADQIYPGWTFTTQHFITEIHRRAAFHSWALRHFAGKPNLIVVNIEAPGSIDWVAGQLGLKAPESERQHANKGAKELTSTTRKTAEAACAACGLDRFEQTAFFTAEELRGQIAPGQALAQSGLPYLI